MSNTLLMQNKKPLLLLHGALGSADQLAPLANALEDHFMVYSFTFAGHGGKENTAEPFMIEGFARELETWLQTSQLQGLPVFGYSMGGYVALFLASRQPAYFTQILTLGTKFHWTPEGAAREAKKLVPAVVEEKVPKFAQLLAKRHQPLDWRRVMEQTAAMMVALGHKPLLTREVLETIALPVTIMRGSEDQMVNEEESLQAATWLPQAKLKTLAGQPHPLEQLDIRLLTSEIIQNLGSGN